MSRNLESIREYVSSLARGEGSCLGTVRDELSNIQVYNPKLNAFVTIFDGEDGPAITTARQRDSSRRRTTKRGPLFGLPVTFKDSIFFAGFPTTDGSVLLKDFIPVQNAWIVDRLLQLGAVPLGKTNLHEFALGPTCSNALGGPIHNPVDDTRISGGSSGGSAVAVAKSIGPTLSIGGDTGGSVRIPAALSGVCGFKPSQGLLNAEGVFPLGPTFDHLGLLTKTMADMMLSFEAVTGTPGVRRTKKGRKKRIGVPKRYFIEDMDDKVSKDFWMTLDRLRANCEIVEVAADSDFARFSLARTNIQLKEAAWLYREFLVSPKSRNLIHRDVLALMDRGLKVGELRYMRATLTRLDALRAGERLLDGLDAMVMPTCPIVAPKIEDVLGKETGRIRPMLIRNTEFFNACGFPALSLPTHTGGLPTSIQVAGPFGSDTEVLEIGDQIYSLVH